MGRWAWAGACCRGTSHVKSASRRQDAFSAFAVRDGAVLTSIVSDGAGSSSHGGEGASLVCRTFADRIRKHFAATDELPSDESLWQWLDAARDRIEVAATRRELVRRDFAATLIVTISDGSRSLVAHVGDGCSVMRDREAMGWSALIWPAQGEYASTTSFVTDDPEAQMRIARSDTAIDAVASFTDGIERLALDFSSRQAHQPFFRGMILPLEQSVASGPDRRLSRQLAGYLDGEAVNQRTDDDKTLILALLR